MKNATLHTAEPILVTHRTGTNVSIFYSDPERSFVPLLEALLDLHGHKSSSTIATDHAEARLRERAQASLREAGAVVIVLGDRSALSPWIRGEIMAFRADNPDAPVVPVVLTPANPDWLLPLATEPSIDFSECMLTGFHKLFAVLGSRFLAREELREPAPPRVDRRAAARRATGMRLRLQTGLLLAYCRDAERSVFERMTVSPEEMAALETILAKEVRRYSYANPSDGRLVDPLQALHVAALRVGREVGERNDLEIVKAVRGIADQLSALYGVQRIDRRTADAEKR